VHLHHNKTNHKIGLVEESQAVKFWQYHVAVFVVVMPAQAHRCVSIPKIYLDTALRKWLSFIMMSVKRSGSLLLF